MHVSPMQTCGGIPLQDWRYISKYWGLFALGLSHACTWMLPPDCVQPTCLHAPPYNDWSSVIVPVHVAGKSLTAAAQVWPAGAVALKVCVYCFWIAPSTHCEQSIVCSPSA